MTTRLRGEEVDRGEGEDRPSAEDRLLAVELQEPRAVDDQAVRARAADQAQPCLYGSFGHSPSCGAPCKRAAARWSAAPFA